MTLRAVGGWVYDGREGRGGGGVRECSKKKKSDDRGLGGVALGGCEVRRRGLGDGGLGGFVWFGGDGVRVSGGLGFGLGVVAGDAFHAFFEAAEAFAEAFAEFRQFFAAEEKNGETRQNDEVPRLK